SRQARIVAVEVLGGHRGRRVDDEVHIRLGLVLLGRGLDRDARAGQGQGEDRHDSHAREPLPPVSVAADGRDDAHGEQGEDGETPAEPGEDGAEDHDFVLHASTNTPARPKTASPRGTAGMSWTIVCERPGVFSASWLWISSTTRSMVEADPMSNCLPPVRSDTDRSSFVWVVVRIDGGDRL